MTNKLFYQQAAAEIAEGNMDQALLIKVKAHMPTAAKDHQQARYIQLRAREFAIESARKRAVDSVPLFKRVLAVSLSAAAVILVISGVIFALITRFG